MLRHSRFTRDAAVALASCLIATTAWAATVTVTTDNDLDNGDTSSIANLQASDGGDGISLREAIEAANNTAGDDTIEFDAALNGQTILLVSGNLQIDATLTINGLGADQLAIDGNGGPIFLVDGANASKTFTLNDITLTGAVNTVNCAGSGDETLNVNRIVARGNTDPNSDGSVVVASFAQVNITDSAFVENNHGIGVDLSSASATITNSTFSDNTMDAISIFPGFGAASNLTLTNVTVADNGTGVEIRGVPSTTTLTIDYENSIFAGNTAGNFNPSGNIDGTLTFQSLGRNILDDATGDTPPDATDLINTDPLLYPLTEVDGTYVRPLRFVSPAIDTIPLADAPTFDQRGASRFDGDGDLFVDADAGAYELPSSPQAAPGFAKAFAPDSVGVGVASTLTFTIDSSVNTFDDYALAFSDTLPAGLVVATPPGATKTCTGGTFTATAGSSTISYTDGIVAAGATCTLSVDVVAVSPDTYNNVSGSLTSDFGDSGTASDSLTVTASAPGFSKAFAAESVATNTPITLIFTIDNSANAAPATALAFSDSLPAGLVIASPANATKNCAGGTLTANDGAATISYSGGSVAANASCTISVDVSAMSPGSYSNVSSALTSGFGNSGTAADSLIATVPPGFAKAFAPDSVGVGVASTLTFTIDNVANALTATGLDFTDSLPSGLVIASPANATKNCSGGTLTATAGTATISYTGGSAPSGASCTVSVDVVSASPGSYANVSGSLTSAFGDSGTASDTLAVFEPLTFSKAFQPSSIPAGQPTLLTYTIDNSANIVAASSISFSEDLSLGAPGTTILASPAPSTTCSGGSLTATPGTSFVSLTNGSLAAGATCTVVLALGVDANPGMYTFTSEALTSNLGDSGTAAATLNIGPLAVPTLATAGLLLLVGLLLGVVVVRRDSQVESA